MHWMPMMGFYSQTSEVRPCKGCYLCLALPLAIEVVVLGLDKKVVLVLFRGTQILCRPSVFHPLAPHTMLG